MRGPCKDLGSILLLLALLTGCRSANMWQRSELFLGMGRENSADVSDAEFSAFLDEFVTPRFASGYTVIPAQGHWREAGRTRAEPSRILIILHPHNVEDDRKIEEIRAAYKSRFKQEAVLRVDDEERVGF